MKNKEFLEKAKEGNWDLEKMRFFVGEKQTQPKCFGIYQLDDGNWVVYKNKSNGETVIHFTGGEDAAFQIFYDKIQSENVVRKTKAEANAKALDALDTMSRANEALQREEKEKRNKEEAAEKSFLEQRAKRDAEAAQKERKQQLLVSFAAAAALTILAVAIVYGIFSIGSIMVKNFDENQSGTGRLYTNTETVRRSGYYLVGDDIYYMTAGDWYYLSGDTWRPYYNYQDSWYDDYYGDSYEFSNPYDSWAYSPFYDDYSYDGEDAEARGAYKSNYGENAEDVLHDEGLWTANGNDFGQYFYDSGKEDTNDWSSDEWYSYDNEDGTANWDSDYSDYDSYNNWDAGDTNWDTDW